MTNDQKKIEYTYETCIDSIDGEYVYYYEIYEKNDKEEVFVDRSIGFYDTSKECDEAAEQHCESLEKGEEYLT